MRLFRRKLDKKIEEREREKRETERYKAQLKNWEAEQESIRRRIEAQEHAQHLYGQVSHEAQLAYGQVETAKYAALKRRARA